MAGTVHEVENHALLAEVEREAANAAQELVEAARLHRGQIPEGSVPIPAAVGDLHIPALLPQHQKASNDLGAVPVP